MKKQKYCSHECYSRCKIGKPHSWGHKISLKLRGKPKSKEHIEKVRLALIGKKRPDMTGENHPQWRGEMAMYGTLHDWISRKLGIPKHCEECLAQDESIRYQWANISGKYSRNLKDWRRLCVKCHRTLDKNTPRASLIFAKRSKGLFERIDVY